MAKPLEEFRWGSTAVFSAISIKPPGLTPFISIKWPRWQLQNLADIILQNPMRSLMDRYFKRPGSWGRMKHVEEQLEGPQHAGVVAETLNCQRKEAPQFTSQRCESSGKEQFPSTAGQSLF